MVKRRFNFGDDYLAVYAKAVFKIKRHGKHKVDLILQPRRHRDAQQWAYSAEGNK
jgi:hypothetical protein